MKTLRAFLFLLMLTSLVAFVSCKKKDDPTPSSVDGLLTYKAWQMTSESSGGDQTLKKYEEDDYWVFYSNGTCAVITGETVQGTDTIPTKKDPAKYRPSKQINAVSTWALSGDHQTLITPLVGGSSQISITRDKLVLTRITGAATNNSATYQVWTFKPKEGEVVVGAVALDGDYTTIDNNKKLVSTFNARFASSDLATEVGFCWAEGSESPTIDNPNNYLAEDDLGTIKLTGLAGFQFKKGAKKFTVDTGKTYYLRAYAKNSKGTFYSNAKEIWGVR